MPGMIIRAVKEPDYEQIEIHRASNAGFSVEITTETYRILDAGYAAADAIVSAEPGAEPVVTLVPLANTLPAQVQAPGSIDLTYLPDGAMVSVENEIGDTFYGIIGQGDVENVIVLTDPGLYRIKVAPILPATGFNHTVEVLP